jgi:hypothetical protein
LEGIDGIGKENGETMTLHIGSVDSPATVKALNKLAESMERENPNTLNRFPFVNRAVYSREQIALMVRRGEISDTRAQELLRASYEIGVDFASGPDKSVRLHADGHVDEWDRDRGEWRSR